MGELLYVEVSFKLVTEGESLASSLVSFFYNIIRLDAPFRLIIKKYVTVLPNPVYIPAEIAHPEGIFFDNLVSRPERLKAFFIACHGRQNPLMCKHCIRSYTKSVTSNNEHVLYPFHACLSISGFQDGSCANCVWNADSACEWRFLSNYQPKAVRGGPLDLSLAGHLANSTSSRSNSYFTGVLNRQSCPRITNKWPTKDAAELKAIKKRCRELEDTEFRPC